MNSNWWPMLIVLAYVAGFAMGIVLALAARKEVKELQSDAGILPRDLLAVERAKAETGRFALRRRPTERSLKLIEGTKYAKKDENPR